MTVKDKYDIVIIGGGGAGVSAALTCLNRGKSAAVIANGAETSSLYKAERITNFPGVPAVSGRELSEILLRQLESSGAELIHGRALSVIPLGDSFGVAVGSEFTSCSAVILAAGITREKLYPGEGEFLGRGVSYCATCDGMLYRGKTVAVITVSVTKLVQGLDYADGAIVTDRRMHTNIPGVFAAGDCTGKPYQLAKAAGEGNVAALSACEYIDNKKKEN